MTSPDQVLLSVTMLRPDEKLLLTALRAEGLKAQPLLMEDLAEVVAGHSGPPALALIRNLSHRDAISVSRRLEHAGVTTLNRASTIETCNDKGLQALLFARSGIPHPVTRHAFSYDQVRSTVAAFGLPSVVKPVSGSWGRGVTKMANAECVDAWVGGRESADAAWEALPGGRAGVHRQARPRPARGGRRTHSGGGDPARVGRLAHQHPPRCGGPPHRDHPGDREALRSGRRRPGPRLLRGGPGRGPHHRRTAGAGGEREPRVRALLRPARRQCGGHLAAYIAQQLSEEHSQSPCRGSRRTAQGSSSRPRPSDTGRAAPRNPYGSPYEASHSPRTGARSPGRSGPPSGAAGPYLHPKPHPRRHRHARVRPAHPATVPTGEAPWNCSTPLRCSPASSPRAWS